MVAFIDPVCLRRGDWLSTGACLWLCAPLPRIALVHAFFPGEFQPVFAVTRGLVRWDTQGPSHVNTPRDMGMHSRRDPPDVASRARYLWRTTTSFSVLFKIIKIFILNTAHRFFFGLEYLLWASFVIGEGWPTGDIGRRPDETFPATARCCIATVAVHHAAFVAVNSEQDPAI